MSAPRRVGWPASTTKALKDNNKETEDDHRRRSARRGLRWRIGLRKKSTKGLVCPFRQRARHRAERCLSLSSVSLLSSFQVFVRKTGDDCIHSLRRRTTEYADGASDFRGDMRCRHGGGTPNQRHSLLSPRSSSASRPWSWV